ncbi:hypothetical protein D3C85_840160 [compost metagenome]
MDKVVKLATAELLLVQVELEDLTLKKYLVLEFNPVKGTLFTFPTFLLLYVETIVPKSKVLVVATSMKKAVPADPVHLAT